MSYEDKIKYIDKSAKNWEKSVSTMQVQLNRMIEAEIITKLKTSEGLLSVDTYNINIVSLIDKVYEKFINKYQVSDFKVYAEKILGLTNYNKAYFNSIGFRKSVIDKIAKNVDIVKKSIGLNSEGNIISGSYLDKVMQGEAVRNKAKGYIINSLNEKKNYKEFATGFRELIEGKKGVNNGLLQQYHAQYTYDLMNKTDAAEGVYFADELDLGWFIYQGSIIKTTRRFCAKRAGQVFNREEALMWKCDPDLIGKGGQSCDDSYNPFIERGRYNCRHHIRWISNEMAEERDPVKYAQYVKD